MIITKAPFRVSFFGGGSDLKEFYSKHPGAVLSATINKYMYISSHPFFHENKIRAKYSKTETVDRLNDLKHPILREVLGRFHIPGGLEISSIADVPGGTGLGSSSAFTVALLQNLYARKGEHVSKEHLAEEACDIEINRLKEPIGKQDQYTVALGGVNEIQFRKDGSVLAEPIHMKKELLAELERSLLIFYTGKQRPTASILSEQRKNMRTKNKFDALKEMVDLVPMGRDALYSGKLERFGELLHKSWMLKKELASGISNPDIDRTYQAAQKAGAIGGKVLGAGGGGFLLLYCPTEKQSKIRNALKPMRELIFKFERDGAKTIYIGDE